MSPYLVMSRLKIFNYLYSLSSPSSIASKSRNFASQICHIFVDKSTKVICQGISEISSFHSKKSIEYGTKMVGFVEKLREGETHLGLPVYNTVKQAKAEADPYASIIIVPPEIAANSILEAIRAKLELVVCISEVLPHEVDKVKDALRQSATRLIGPNCPGIIKPRECKLGIMHMPVHTPGCIAIVARCGNVRNEYSFLAFEQAVIQTTNSKLGQSTSVGIGRDPFIRTSLIDCVKQFLSDPDTKGIIIIGETGEGPEEEAAQFIEKSGTNKPVIVYIAPTGLNMHHPLP